MMSVVDISRRVGVDWLGRAAAGTLACCRPAPSMMSIVDISRGVRVGWLGRAAGPGRLLTRRRGVFEAIERVNDPSEALPSEAVEFPVLEAGDRALIDAGQGLKLALRQRVSETTPPDRVAKQGQAPSDAWISRPRIRIPVHEDDHTKPRSTRSYPRDVMSLKDIAKTDVSFGAVRRSRLRAVRRGLRAVRRGLRAVRRGPMNAFRGSVGSMTEFDQVCA